MMNDQLNALAMMTINRSLVQDVDTVHAKVMKKFIYMKNRHRVNYF